MDKERQHIDELLGRFMQGESTLDEERVLGEWFRCHEVDGSLEPYRRMFAYFDAGMPARRRTAPRRARRMWWQAAVAAMLTALVAWAGGRLLSKPDALSPATMTTGSCEMLVAMPADDEPEADVAIVTPPPVKAPANKRRHAAPCRANTDSAEIAHTEATLELAESEYQAEQAELQQQLQQLRQQQHTRQNGWVTVSLPCQ